jgi:hypothetical protein
MMECLLSGRRGSRVFLEKLPAYIDVGKNQIETALQGSVTVPALHPQIKVSLASAANMILEPSCAASAPRYI